MEVIEHSRCSGCQVCKNVCPVGAIKMVYETGFEYPEIDEARCIHCGLCEKKCPVIGEEKSQNSLVKVYAAWVKDDAVRVNSTSGGICYALSQYVISGGGYVAGVSWNNGFKEAQYELISDMEGLARITQTKYLQPSIGNIYKETKEVLEKGIRVLFIGTACVNAALRSYLGKSYSNLICCEFICRGYTSNVYHRKRVEWLEDKYGSSIVKLQFKNKKLGWERFGTLFEFANGKRLYVNREEDPYEIMFQRDDFNTRPSCFDCKYRTLPRLSDITLGDFWEIENVSNKERQKGISAVLINSDKGKELLDEVSDSLYLEERSLDEVSKGNYALLHQIRKSGRATEFFDDLNSFSMDEFNAKYAKSEKMIVKRFNSKMNKIRDLLSCNLIQFLYYNFFCKNVIRKKGRFIIPYKGTKIDIREGGKLIINHHLYLNCFKHKHSHEETYITIGENAKFEVNGRTRIATKNTIDIGDSAELIMGTSETNAYTSIVSSNKIIMGEDVRIGRNVTIYDSSFHSTGINKSNKGKPVIIGNHVWLCTGVTIAKGVKIGDGAICGINSTIMKNVKSSYMVSGNPAREIMANVQWD